MSLVLVVVSGRPASGKTSVAQRIAASCRLPLLAKDDVKEALMDVLGWDDPEFTRRLGAASFAVVASLAEQFLSTGASCVVEGPFLEEYEGPRFRDMLARHGAGVVQVLVTADADVRARRAEERAGEDRHPGHRDLAWLERASDTDPTEHRLDLPGPVVEVDTSEGDWPDDVVLAAVRAGLA